MKISQRNSFRAGVGKGLLIAVTVLIAFAIFLGIQWRPAKVIEQKQAALVAAIGTRDKGKIRKLLAENYKDRWEFSADDAAEAIVDVGSQFLTLYIQTPSQEMQRSESGIVVITELEAEGNPLGPVGNEVLRRINRLDAPFLFKWEKQSLFPTSWKVVEIDNPDLPAELYGYQPGDFRRAMEGAGESLGE